MGIDVGLAWGVEAEATVVYTDHGISRGMRYGIDRAEREGRKVDGPHAIGPMLSKGGGEWNTRLRVTSGGQVTEYILDRWD